jgi:bilirubin oxidase
VLFNADTNAPPFSIDSINYAPGVINDTVLLGAVEQWQIGNTSQVAHPFHIHDISFYVTSYRHNGQLLPVPSFLRGPKDVIFVENGDTVEYITQFNDFYTPADPDSSYMYHCHILSHEDGGMMHQFVVVKPTTGGSGVPVSFNDAEFSAWNLYPNPSSGAVHVSAECPTASTLRVFNILGERVAELPIPPVDNSTPLTLPKLDKGVWTVQWNRTDGVFTKRVVIQ